MTHDPKYYEVSAHPTESDTETFLATVIDAILGRVADTGNAGLDFTVRYVGLANVANFSVTLSHDQDGWYANGTKFLADTTGGQVTQLVVTSALEEVALLLLGGLEAPAIVGIGLAVGGALAATVIWDKFDATLGVSSKIDAVFNTQDVDITYEVNGRAVSGVLYDALPTTTERNTALINMTNHVEPAVGATMTMKLNGEVDSKYVILPEDTLSLMAKAMAVDLSTFSAWSWGHDSHDQPAANGTLILDNPVADVCIANQECAVALQVTTADGQSTENLSVAFRDIGVGGPATAAVEDGFAFIIGGDDVDFLIAPTSAAAIIFGGLGPDSIDGSDQADRLFGDTMDQSANDNGEADTIHGEGGDDLIIGGGGGDQLHGDSGIDRIYGGYGQDVIHGGNDGDYIWGDTEVTQPADGELGDTIYGDGGEDTLNGSYGNDQIYGGTENDKLFGHEGNDLLEGEAGDDTLDGGAGNDTLNGDTGFDRYYVGAGDTVTDSDHSGAVFVGSNQLTVAYEPDEEGGPNHKAAGDKVFYDSNGNSFTFDGTDLTIHLTGGGETIIHNWAGDENGTPDLGIVLKPHDPSGGGGDRTNAPQNNRSPLVLDLDGDGVELTGLQGAPVYFDIDGDGKRERTSWVGSDDGVLVMDHNSNGTIDDSSEMFGYGYTVSISSDLPDETIANAGVGVKWTSGFQLLRGYDSNQDLVFSAADSAFSAVKVWRDLNQDGVSTSNELFGLSDLGIASISLSSHKVSESQSGDIITDRSTFDYAAGGHGDVADVWFQFDQQDTIEDAITDPDLLALPNLKGVGAVTSLRASAAADPTLKTMLESFAAIDAGDATTLINKVEDILFRWHHVVAGPTSRGSFTDGRHFDVYNSLTDTTFAQFGEVNSPRPFAGAIIEENYQLYLRNSAALLLMQTDYGKSLFPELSVKGGNFLFLEEGTNSADILDRLADGAPEGTLEAMQYWHSMLKILDCVYESFADVSSAAAYRNSVTSFLSEHGIQVSYEDLMDGYFGSNGDDAIVTKIVEGGLSYQNTPVIVGGGGDDTVYATAEKQVVYFGEGQGHDVIVGTPTSYWSPISPAVEVRLVGLALEDISIARVSLTSLDVVVTILSTGETLTLKDALGIGAIQPSIAFGGVAAVPLFELNAETAALLAPTAGDDVLDDRLGLDSLAGGHGNDVLIGQAGNDVYHFEAGDGDDVVVEDVFGGDDTLSFDGGLTDADLTFSRSGERGADLNVNVAGGGRVVVSREFADPLLRVEFMQTGDGVTSIAQMSAGAFVPNEDGRVFGFDTQNDAIELSGSGTTFSGLNGGDTYVVTSSAQDVTITDLGNKLDRGIDQLVLLGDLSDYSITRTENDSFVFDNGDGIKVTVDSLGGAVETFVFDDQTLSYSDVVGEILRQERLAGKSEIVGTSLTEVLDGTAGDDAIYGVDGDDIINGLAGRDLIVGGSGDQTLNGGDGADRIEASYGNDDISGGAGDDVIVDKGGAGTVHFNLGDGNDIVLNSLSGGQLVFGAGISSSDLRVTFEAVDPTQYTDFWAFQNTHFGVRVSVAGTNDSVLLIGPYGETNPAGTSWLMEFESDTSISLSDLLPAMRAPSDDDQLIVGSKNADDLSGGGGDDVIAGSSGDAVTASTVDTFHYDRGDGNDTIVGGAFGHGHVAFGANVAVADIRVSRSGNHNQNLVLTDSVTGQSITILNQYVVTPKAESNGEQIDGTWVYSGHYETRPYVSTITFADSTTWTAADVLAMTLTHTTGDDRLVGSGANDILDGGAGNDMLIGGAGSDTYLFGLASGQDVVVEALEPFALPLGGDFPTMANGLREVDELHFGPGITRGDLELITTGLEAGDLLIRIKGTSDTILLRGQLSPQESWGQNTEGLLDNDPGAVYGRAPLYASGIERFVFDDGTSIDRQSFLGLVGNDIVYGSDGQDVLITLGGNDYVAAGGGNDTVDGGSGNDRLFGEGGNDVLVGGAGDDVIIGDGGDDELTGGLGDDQLNGWSGADTYHYAAGDGSDRIIEQIASDGDALILTGIADLSTAWLAQDGDDLIIQFAEGGDIRVVGQFPDWLPSGGIETIIDGNGTQWDKDDIQALVDLGQQPAPPIVGTSGDDVLAGGQRADHIEGLGGNDTLSGGGGWDVLLGGDGNDSLNAGSGGGYLSGGAGDDVLNTSGSSQASLDGGTGDDAYVIDVSAPGSYVDVQDAAGVDVIQLSGINLSEDLLVHVGQYSFDLMVGGSEIWLSDGVIAATAVESVSDGTTTVTYQDLLDAVTHGESTVTADEAGGTLLGDGSDQSFVGDTGDDFFDGRGGADAFSGGDGWDGVGYRLSSSGVTIEMANGVLNTGDAAGDTFTSIEYLVGTDHDDTILVVDGVTQVDGAGGNDTLTSVATATDVSLSGGDGNDTLTGGGGADFLDGGAGDDVLEGGAGDDVFYFTGGDDVVSDSDASDVGDTLFLPNGGFGAEINFAEDGNDVVITIAGGDDWPGGSVRLVDELVDTDARGVDIINDGNGLSLTKADLIDMFA